MNTLNILESAQGYYMHLNQDAQITLRGRAVDLSQIAFSLTEGWNLISYPSLNAENIEIALSSISDYIIQVNSQTQGYNPSLPDFLNTLHQLTPGEGYWIKVSQNCTLTF